MSTALQRIDNLLALLEPMTSEQSNRKFCLVTGSNKLDGLGFATVLQCCKLLDIKNTDIFLSGRKMQQLQTAQKTIKEKFGFDVKCFELSFSEPQSVEKLVKFVKSNYSGVDYFVHNADAFPPDVDPNAKVDVSQVERYLTISNKGTQLLMKNIYPLLNNNSRVVVISSGYGLMKSMSKNQKQYNTLKNKNATLEELNSCIDEYLKDYKEGRNVPQERWGLANSNQMGKIARSFISRFYNNKVTNDKNKKNVCITPMCPGWVRTGAVKGILDNNEELNKIAKEPLDAAKFILDVLLAKDTNFGGRLIQYGKDLKFDE